MTRTLAVARLAAALALGMHAAAGATEEKRDRADIASRPAPTQGSMPTGGPVPTGKMGTPPTGRGKLGTEPPPGKRKPLGPERAPSSRLAPK